MKEIIKLNRSIIPACDVNSLRELSTLVKKTSEVEGIGAYKIGFQLALKYGLGEVVKVVKMNSGKPVIYDHQKAATDIPDMGVRFAAVCKETDVDAVILFPLAGAETEKAWIKACREQGLGVIVGGEMTHKAFLEGDGGFISKEAPVDIYHIAADEGVRDFVVPGNKPERIEFYRHILEGKKIEPILYSPGLVAQGGRITDSGKEAGEKWHAIVGRAIYQASDIRKAAEEFTRELK